MTRYNILMQGPANNKIRLDNLLLELGFFDSREKARTCIMMNGVHLAGKVENKAGKQINIKNFYKEYDKNPGYISVEDKLLPYVSRGAFKLKAAKEVFDLNFENKRVLDIGASTGGFTDFALQDGASEVIALDVGHGQLHYKLQNHDQVINLENTNFRHWLPDEKISLPINFVVCDVSFISIVTILERLKTLIQEEKYFKNLEIIILLKPQFEAGKEIMDKCQGVIKDEQILAKVCQETKAKIENLAYQIQAEIESPIKGAKGNTEYLLKLKY